MKDDKLENDIKKKLNDFFIKKTKKKFRTENKELKDCEYTTKELDLDKEIENDNKMRSRLKIQNTIKKLDIWDTENLLVDKKNNFSDYKIFIENKIKDIKGGWEDSLKSTINHAKECKRKNTMISNSDSLINFKNPKNINSSLEKQYIPDFLNDEEKEQISILLQNIKIFRQKFDFGVFKIKNNSDHNKDFQNLNSIETNNYDFINNTNVANNEISKKNSKLNLNTEYNLKNTEYNNQSISNNEITSFAFSTDPKFSIFE